MAYENVILEKENELAILTINRPKALNALNKDTLLDIKAVIEDIKNDPAVKVLIITGSGEKSFVAGADIAYMKDFNVRQARDFAQLGQQVFRTIELMEKPVIAAVNGFALGGGCELALSCDIRLASENAVFGQPEVGLGVIPGYGGTQRLPRLIGEGLAKELIFSSSNLKAYDAYRVGLVNHVYQAAELMTEAKKLAVKIARQAPVAVGYAKAAIGRGMQVDLDTAMQIESDLFSMCYATEDQREGMNAFVEKRKPQFKAG
ncbi:MAG: short-chain-enoyl-CoA hydratase [Syntrophomonadaceae bacterium]|nr:short-chain-enoyl-CoA hydratase [Syntrophomonadaceae bacterium]